MDIEKDEMAARKNKSEEDARRSAFKKLEAQALAVDAEVDASPSMPLGALREEPELEFGRRLKELREARGFTQGQLAEATKSSDPTGKGISRAVISLYETGTNRPGITELRILSEVFRTNPAHFIYGTDDPFEHLLERRRFGFYQTSAPEFLALLTYAFSKLTKHHKRAMFELITALAFGPHAHPLAELSDEAAEEFIKTADAMRALRARQKAQEQAPEK